AAAGRPRSGRPVVPQTNYFRPWSAGKGIARPRGGRMTAPRFRFLPKHHLRKPADFQRVFERRNAASDDRLIVYAADNGLEHPRLGLSVSRKLGGAVQRNRWK